MDKRLKVCGMKVPSNIEMVADLQPDYIGFIFYKGSKRYVADLSAQFVKDLPSNIKRTGVFVNEELRTVVERVLEYGLHAVQLHGDEPASYARELKALIDIEVIKAFGIDDQFDFDQLDAYSNSVDYFLFDTKTPDHGGSGRVFNWDLLKKYSLDKPYFLSGGIDLESIDEINRIKDERFYAVDVNSKFELEPGLKDIDKLIDFKNMLSY
ncbi:N-(5'-phosphoribosyl)anthranilate isomerase [Pedobacter ginsengisoli]|uniref:N-(5'-phosphoribosyl)anthranilate isomerase n=1 Tax=Pedobacter ginsengisoli TaxID=363852 RepID=A0A2D1U5Y4_9SPHI|nr:phosphoribosylanthranilate isomerase [Pedobacter ginsengisoli]ATP57002.1 N-(5'-phosphoribosyl)anthranilate isomerase [Pedobacter ginsengisoli]